MRFATGFVTHWPSGLPDKLQAVSFYALNISQKETRGIVSDITGFVQGAKRRKKTRQKAPELWNIFVDKGDGV